MTDGTFYETNKPLLNDLITKRDEFGLKSTTIEIIWRQDFGTEPLTDHMIMISGSESISQKDNVEKFRNYIESLNNEKIQEEIECEAGVGSNFPQVENCLHVSSNKTKTFTIQKGEVTLVDVWATWCGPCQGPMAHNQEMLEKHPEWAGKVRVVGLSSDENLDDLKKRIEERKWDKVEHYQLQGGWGNPLMTQYGINGIPCVFLVDKEGVVVFKGHPASIDLEKAIDNLLNNLPISGESGAESLGNNKVTIKEKDEVCEAISKFIEENKAIIPNKKFYMSVCINKKVTKENIEDSSTFDGEVTLICQEVCSSPDNITKFKTTITNLLANHPNFKFTATFFFKPSTIAKVGNECLKCNTSLDNNVPRYFCLECQLDNKDKYTFCSNCIKDDEDFENNPTHEHVLYYLPAGCENTLDKLTNIREKSKKIQTHSGNQHTNYGCDNCGKGCMVVDWSCAVCHKHVNGSFDLCNDCFKLSTDPSKQGELKPHVEHDYKTHALIRVPYTMRTFADAFKKIE
jgi:thiol-disulfide isomerase/thioredoxin/predicted amidophosphoribosyltransferase